MLTARSKTSEAARAVSKRAYRGSHTHLHTPTPTPTATGPLVRRKRRAKGLNAGGRPQHREVLPPSWQLVRRATASVWQNWIAPLHSVSSDQYKTIAVSIFQLQFNYPK
jgi:hypothetical protein